MSIDYELLADGLREIIAKQVGLVEKKYQIKIDELESKLKELDPDTIALTAAELIPTPADGKDGEPGEAGADGKDGEPGAAGADGLDGMPGAAGADGRDGMDGKDGEPGPAGADGRDGVDGKDGEPGPAGKDGRDGKDGEPGPAGADGRDGVDGKDGEPGPAGADGRDGVDGKDGEPGPAGADGRDGVDGKDGRDAMDIEIAPTINPEKSYPRGSFATFEGGLWRAFEQTHGFRGWECLVNGLKSIEIEQGDDLRTFTMRQHTTNGEVYEKAFSVPVMIYREIFSAGKSYLPGDTVTFGGSLWHCSEPTTDRPGEPGSKGWRLAVKKGRDAK